MSRKLILHVGANKTGSSAIQRFLALNTSSLRAMGVVVPDDKLQDTDETQGNHVFYLQNLLENPHEGRRLLAGALDKLSKAFPRADTMLISAENLAANPNAPYLFEGLIDRFDVQVVMYVRRQDEYILSSWQQWYSKVSSDFWAWLILQVGVIGDWQTYLENWEKVVPRDCITARVYERSKLDGGDVVTDFLRASKIPGSPSEFVYPRKNINPSFSDAITELVAGNETIFRNAHDNEFYNFVAKITGDKYMKSSRQSVISFPQRRAIVARYQQQNEWVRRNYFPELDGSLFSAPKESDYDYISSDELEREKLEFLTSMMYQIYKRGIN